MISEKKNKVLWYMLLCLSVISLTVACGIKEVELESNPAAVSEAAQVQLGGSNVFQKAPESELGEVEKNDLSTDEVFLAYETGEDDLQTNVETIMTPSPVFSQSTELIQPTLEEPTPVFVEPTALPQIDLSIPAEPRVGSRAPDFSLQTLEGGVLQLSGLFGQPFLISYWATWCGPCMNELSILGRIYAEYQGQGLKIVTINAIEQDNLSQVQQMVMEQGINFPVLLDKDEQFARSYQAMFFPTTYYVDQNGVIREIVLGDTSEGEFRQKIENLLSGNL
jgi:peroxiredoxin